jgi:hypothetical protein
MCLWRHYRVANRLSPAQWREILAVFRHRCAYCGTKASILTQDHLTPLSRLGDEHETCKIPEGRDVNQSVSHVRRVKANLTPAPIRNVPAQRSIH